jgi:hypothetical protein
VRADIRVIDEKSNGNNFMGSGRDLIEVPSKPFVWRE